MTFWWAVYCFGALVELVLIVRLWLRDAPPSGVRLVCALASALFVALWPFTVLPTLLSETQ